MAEESPFIEENPEQKAEAKADPVNVDALIETLEKFDVQDPEKLQGRLQNANDYASMRSERDTIANEVAQLRAEIMQNKQQPSPQPVDDYGEGQPIDIESMVMKSVDKALTMRDQKMMQHQQQMNATWQKITNHKRYNLVKDDFENALKDPATVMKLQSGQVDAFEFYSDLVMDKIAGVAKQTVEAFKQIKDTTGVSPPHLESNASVPQNASDKRTASQKKADSLIEKAKSSPMGLPEGDIEDLLAEQMSDILK